MAATAENVCKLLEQLSPEDRETVATILRKEKTRENPAVAVFPPAQMNTNPPRLSQFSGSGAKGEISYEQWRFEVRGIQKDATTRKLCFFNRLGGMLEVLLPI